MTNSCLGQFPPQTAASPDEQKVFALWESGDMSDQVRCLFLLLVFVIFLKSGSSGSLRPLGTGQWSIYGHHKFSSHSTPPKAGRLYQWFEPEFGGGWGEAGESAVSKQNHLWKDNWFPEYSGLII